SQRVTDSRHRSQWRRAILGHGGNLPKVATCARRFCHNGRQSVIHP
ncbi:MAG: hypothetical protein SLRJCFUN_000549, partial [Candidatus Fervidibacter sp.]